MRVIVSLDYVSKDRGRWDNFLIVLIMFRWWTFSEQKAKLWSVEDHEREDEYKRVQGVREDAHNYFTRFCFLAQDIYYQSQDLLDGGRVQLDEELMMDGSFELHISRRIPLHERLATTHCLPWDYFQSIFDIWSRDQFIEYLVLSADEEWVLEDNFQ